MKKIKDNAVIVAIMLVVALFAVGIGIQGCGSESYDTSGLTSGPALFSCGATTTGVGSSISINEGAASTQKKDVRLTLHGEDSDNIAAYYVSESSTPPLAADPGWVAVSTTPCSVFDATGVAFAIAGGATQGWYPTTVYVWFKDSLGNISTATSDDITFIVPAPAC